MTLSTDFIVRSPGAKPRDVFDVCNAMLGRPIEQIVTDEFTGWRGNPGWHNALGQGLPALLSVEYGADGPLVKPCYCNTGEPEYTDVPCPGGSCDFSDQPDGFIRVNWDTGYGFRGDNGEGCGDLHAAYIERLGAWCDERGLSWSWENEFTGEWHAGRDGLDELGDGGKAATAWFTNAVLPAITGGL